MSLWNTNQPKQSMHQLIRSAIDAELPQPNHYLISEFKPNQIHEIKDYLEYMFKQMVSILESYIPDSEYKLQYHSFSKQSPDDRIKRMRADTSYTGNFAIQESNLVVYEFKFSYGPEELLLTAPLPYVDNYCVMIEGSRYYPLFAMVEKGGLCVIHQTKNPNGTIKTYDRILFKVLIARLEFARTKEVTVTCAKGRRVLAHLLTCKIHQKYGVREFPCPLLYLCATLGFDGMVARMGYTKDDMCLVEHNNPDDDKHHYFAMGDLTQGYIRVSSEALMMDIIVRRMVVGMITTFQFNQNFRFSTVGMSEYYKATLGKYTNKELNNDILWIDNAEDHLRMCKVMIDPAASKHLSAIGIQISDLDDLIVATFKNIDPWIASYNVSNLYCKQLGALDQLTAILTITFYRKLFNIVLNGKKSQISGGLKTLFKQSFTKLSWITSSRMFRAEPQASNGNYLFAIGASRFRSQDEVTKQNRGGGGKSKLPVRQLQSHYSQIDIESLYYPSTPIITGSINIFAQIEKDGNFIPSRYLNEFKDVYDR